MTKLGQKSQKFALKQNGGPLKVKFSNLTNFNKMCQIVPYKTTFKEDNRHVLLELHV